MTTQHTPTPWRAVAAHGFSGDMGIIGEGLTTVLAECYADIRASGEGAKAECAANADFIVRACNAHVELIGAGLEVFFAFTPEAEIPTKHREAYDLYLDTTYEDALNREHSAPDRPEMQRRAVARLAASIAKAEGKQ